MCSLRPMVGSATLTIARSATVMKNETASTANARQRRTSFTPRLAPVTSAVDPETSWLVMSAPSCPDRRLIACTGVDPGNHGNSPPGDAPAAHVLGSAGTAGAEGPIVGAAVRLSRMVHDLARADLRPFGRAARERAG